MAKTLANIQAQIQKLQAEADVLKKKEAAGVVERIKEAIAAYGLTHEDLFGLTAVPKKRAKRSDAGISRVGKKSASSAAKKVSKPYRFTDGTNSWTGHGKQPQWFKDALSAGKTKEDLAVKQSE